MSSFSYQISNSIETPSVLIIDDRADNVAQLEAALKGVNASITVVKSGAEGLVFLQANNTALVLLKVNMPDMNGYDVVSILRKSPNTDYLPIIFMVDGVDDEENKREKAYQLGVADFITQPLNTGLLMAKAKVYLRLWRQSNKLKELSVNFESALEDLTLQRDELNELALKDHLTGLYQRRVFDEMIAKEISRSVRHKSFLSIAMLDLDHFKQVNDNYGHAVGDDVLIKTAEILLGMMRSSDLVCRYGGEEFVVLMPNTQLMDAHVISERIRLAIAEAVFETEKGNLKVTTSIGIAEFLLDKEETPELLLKQADDCLYQAKHNGRNQIYPQSFETAELVL